MSLASAQRALAKANRDTLQKSAKGKIAGGLIEGAADLATGIYDLANEAFDFEGNKNAWEDYAAGQEYLGIEKPNEPMKRSQRYLKRPGEVYEGSVKVAGRNKSFTAGEMSSVGSLARSDMRGTYENILGGDLASKVGTPYSAIAGPKSTSGLDGGKKNGLSVKEIMGERKPFEAERPDGTGLQAGKPMFSQVGADERKYSQFESPVSGHPTLAPIADENQYQLGTKSGNQKLEKFLRTEKGMKGKGLSSMIPGWGALTEQERLDKALEFGYSPGQ